MAIRLALAICGLFSGPVMACSAPMFDEAEHGRNALLAVVGYVVGDHYPSYEKRVLAGEDPEILEMPEERVLRVVVTENLVGNSPRLLEVTAPCGMGLPEALERVVVVKNAHGYLQVFPARFAEPQLRNLLRGKL